MALTWGWTEGKGNPTEISKRDTYAGDGSWLRYLRLLLLSTTVDTDDGRISALVVQRYAETRNDHPAVDFLHVEDVPWGE